jgi:hypothetical protein
MGFLAGAASVVSGVSMFRLRSLQSYLKIRFGEILPQLQGNGWKKETGLAGAVGKLKG